MAIVAHLDTWAPRLIVAKKAADRNTGTRLFAQLERGDYDVKVPQIVAGEAVTTAMRDFGPGAWEEPVCRMLQAVERVADPATCFPPPDPDTAELARQMMANVRGMTQADSFVGAHAMLDPLSQKLITNDRILASAAWLAEREWTMRRNGERKMRLKFTDRL